MDPQWIAHQMQQLQQRQQELTQMLQRQQEALEQLQQHLDQWQRQQQEQAAMHRQQQPQAAPHQHGGLDETDDDDDDEEGTKKTRLVLRASGLVQWHIGLRRGAVVSPSFLTKTCAAKCVGNQDGSRS